MTLFPRMLLVAAAAALAAAAWAAPADIASDEADRILREALAKAVDVDKQAKALTTIALLDPAAAPTLRDRAASELMGFAGLALPALLEAAEIVEPSRSADLVRIAVDARWRLTSGIPSEYSAILQAVLWRGSREGKLLAIPELAKTRDRMSVLPMIDSAIDDPAIVPIVVSALGAIGDERARFYLEQVLVGRDAALRDAAARSLAAIGGRALGPLKSALASNDRALRQTAAHALVSAATELDLTALYEYVTNHPDDDPEIVAAAKARAEAIEKAVEARQAADAASGPKDF